MSKSLIQTVNTSTQTVGTDGAIALGNVVRRFGNNLKLSNNAIVVNGEGYYILDAAVTVVPTAAGNVTVAFYENGVQIPGGISYGYASAASAPVTLPIVATIRHKCCCDAISNITCALIAGPGQITQISVRVKKD